MERILERWNRAMESIRTAGWQIREEWLDGSGGLCEFGGKKIFFSDQSLSLFERLDQAEAAVREIQKWERETDEASS